MGPMGWGLQARCQCKESRMPMQFLTRQHGPRATARELLVRMRCLRCGQRPGSAAWVREVRRGEGGRVEGEEGVPAG
jgi:hypothetical protein